jgi:hypothetical protein
MIVFFSLLDGFRFPQDLILEIKIGSYTLRSTEKKSAELPLIETLCSPTV